MNIALRGFVSPLAEKNLVVMQKNVVVFPFWTFYGRKRKKEIMDHLYRRFYTKFFVLYLRVFEIIDWLYGV